jgi:hypothetical protein
MKIKTFSLFAIVSLVLVTCTRTKQDPLLDLNPGHYDSTWWNHSPIRLVQTNLPEIEASMNVDEYVRSVVSTSANVVLLNVGGIVANYPTELTFHYRNPYLKGDLVGDLVSELHENGIKVLGRFDFSKINETIAIHKPEWLYVGTDGKHVNYNGQVHTCINGGYQQEYSLEILKEAISKYPLDGIFFNMIGYTTTDYSGNYHGICQCENCKKRFRESTGSSLPVVQDMSDPGFRAYRAFQETTSDELFNKIRGFAKSLNNEIIINTYTDAGVDFITTESGSSLRDGYEWNYFATSNLKPTLGSYRDRIPCNLLMYFQGIGFRHIGTSPNIARVWLLENMLHGAPVTFVVIGTLLDYEDRIFLPTLNDLFGFHKRNEKLFTNVQSVSNIGLVRGSQSEYQGLIKMLTEEHIMFDVIEPSSIGSIRAPYKLDHYDALILADINNLNSELVNRIDGYIKNGGKVLTTGFSSDMGFLGIEPEYDFFPQQPSTYLKVSEADKLFFGPEEFKDFSLMMLYSGFVKCTPQGDAKGYLKLVPNTMFGPPEKCYYTESEITNFPGVIVNDHGKGKSVFIPWQLGAQYNFKGNYAHRALFVSSLKNVLNIEKTIETNASPLIEMSHLINLNGSFEWIGMINHSGQVGSSFREPVPMYDILVRFRPSKPVKEIHLMRSGEKIKFRQNDGWIECNVPKIDDFEIILCLYKQQ